MSKTARRAVAWLLVLCIFLGSYAFSLGEENIGKTNGAQNADIEETRTAFMTVGNEVTYGNYPQGENGEVMPIEWQVL